MSAYKLTDGSKLNLILKREAALSGTTANSDNQSRHGSPVESIPAKKSTLEEELSKHLRKHFKSEADTKKVISTFMAVSFFFQFLIFNKHGHLEGAIQS